MSEPTGPTSRRIPPGAPPKFMAATPICRAQGGATEQPWFVGSSIGPDDLAVAAVACTRDEQRYLFGPAACADASDLVRVR